MSPLVLTFIGLVVGLGLVVVIKRFLKPDLGDGPITGIILVVPLMLWGATGKLTEVAGLGITAKFAQAAGASVSKQAKSVKDTAVIRLDPKADDLQMQATFEQCHEYILLGDAGVPKAEQEQARYIYIAALAVRASLVCGRLEGVVVIDSTDRYVGSFPASLFLETSALWTTPIASDFSHVDVEAKRILERTIFGAGLKFPSIRAASGEGFVGAINESASMLDALKLIHAKHLPFLALTDALGRFKGVVSARDIEQQLLIDLLE